VTTVFILFLYASSYGGVQWLGPFPSERDCLEVKRQLDTRFRQGITIRGKVRPAIQAECIPAKLLSETP
jgi:hypothetical protein